MCPCKNVDDVFTKMCKEKTQFENAAYVSLYFRCEGSSVKTIFDPFFVSVVLHIYVLILLDAAQFQVGNTREHREAP